MIRKADYPGAQLYVPRAFGCRPDKDLRRGDDLPACAVMFTDPGFIVPQVVQPID
jgi:hypothetical protein